MQRRVFAGFLEILLMSLDDLTRFMYSVMQKRHSADRRFLRSQVQTQRCRVGCIPTIAWAFRWSSEMLIGWCTRYHMIFIWIHLKNKHLPIEEKHSVTLFFFCRSWLESYSCGARGYLILVCAYFWECYPQKHKSNAWFSTSCALCCCVGILVINSGNGKVGI